MKSARPRAVRARVGVRLVKAINGLITLGEPVPETMFVLVSSATKGAVEARKGWLRVMPAVQRWSLRDIVNAIRGPLAELAAQEASRPAAFRHRQKGIVEKYEDA